jgi:hypothetical protein
MKIILVFLTPALNMNKRTKKKVSYQKIHILPNDEQGPHHIENTLQIIYVEHHNSQTSIIPQAGEYGHR